jgi:hypothetical protein
MVIETDRYPALPVQLLVLQLPSRVQNAPDCLKHLGDDDYEVAVRLEGSVLPAELTDLSTRPTAALFPAMRGLFAMSPAAVGIIITRGRVHITINQN